MKKSDLLRALQTEIHKHDLSTFMSEHKIVQTEDVLPPLLDKLSVQAKSGEVSRGRQKMEKLVPD